MEMVAAVNLKCAFAHYKLLGLICYIYKYLQTCIFIYVLMLVSKVYLLFQQCQSRTFLTTKQRMSQGF